MNRSDRTRFAFALVLGVSLAAASMAASADDNDAQSMKSMPNMKMPMDQAVATAPGSSTPAFQQGMANMMQGMNAPYTGDTDADFVSHMIPHHEGAVSMAQVERMYGKDPEMRKLALEIIKAQDREIALMKRWQVKHAAK